MRKSTELMESILTSPEAQKIIDYLSPVYGEAYVFLWILQAIGTALDEAKAASEEYIKQVTPATATWTLGYWENQYGLVTDPSLTIEQRQKRILTEIQSKAPINPEKIRKLLSTIGECEIIVEENIAPNTFGVYVQEQVDEATKKEMLELLDRIKPAHLIYDFSVSDHMYSLASVYNFIYSMVREIMQTDIGEADDKVRIADENNVIMMDESGSILIY